MFLFRNNGDCSPSVEFHVERLFVNSDGLVDVYFFSPKIPSYYGSFLCTETPNIMGLFYVHKIPNIMGLFYVH